MQSVVEPTKPPGHSGARTWWLSEDFLIEKNNPLVPLKIKQWSDIRSPEMCSTPRGTRPGHLGCWGRPAGRALLQVRSGVLWSVT